GRSDPYLRRSRRGGPHPVTAAALLVDLRRRGARLELDGAGLRYRARAGTLTDADRAALRAHRDELLAILHAEASPPTDACVACNTVAWFHAAAWPTPGEARWLCRTCTSRPAPSLAAVVAEPSARHRARLDAEAAAGDNLAQLVLAAVVD